MSIVFKYDQDLMVKVQSRFPSHTITFSDLLGPDDIAPRRSVAVDGRVVKVAWSKDLAQTVLERHGLHIEDEAVEVICDAIDHQLSLCQ